MKYNQKIRNKSKRPVEIGRFVFGPGKLLGGIEYTKEEAKIIDDLLKKGTLVKEGPVKQSTKKVTDAATVS